MMEYIEDVLRKGRRREVELRGFIKDIRNLGKIAFLILSDKTGSIQCVLKKNFLGEKFNKYVNLPIGSYVKVIGEFSENKGIKEINLRDMKILAESKPYPIDITGKIHTSFDKRLDWRFLDMRNEKVRKIFLLESKIVKILQDFLEENGFVRLFFSRITKDATEGGTDYFKVNYFDKKAYLAQSPQLYKEAVLLSGIDKVYDLGFVYRAEPHHTTRHLCEYMSFDIEMVAENLDELLNLFENMMKYLFEKLKNDKFSLKILNEFNVELQKFNKTPVMTFKEANEILKKNGIMTEEYDLTPEGERFLGKFVEEKYNSPFLFITEFPFEKKPFYIMRKGKDLSFGFDALFKGLEISSGGIREHRYEERIKNIREKGLNPEDFDHLRFWQYGMPPHGGFAIGIERFTCKILNLDNVREATLLPRDPDRLSP